MSVLTRVLSANLRCCIHNLNKYPNILCKAFYAAGLKGKMMAGPQQKKLMEVETDANKLCNYVCGINYFKEGEETPILPDSEYPDWLFTLRTDRTPPDLSELSKDDWYYWIRLRKINIRNNNKERKFNKLKKTKRIW